MDSSAFRGMAEALALLFWISVIFVPLGLWKAVELLIWVFSHIAWV